MRAAIALASALALAGLVAACGGGASGAFAVGPGSESVGFLRADTFDAMTIEVSSVVGRSPDPAALALLLQRAREHCHKPRGIEIVFGSDIATLSTGAAGAALRSRADLPLLETHRTRKTSGRTIVLEVFYVDGALLDDLEAVGEAIGPDLIVIFKDQLGKIRDPNLASRAEGSTLLHELGHQLGLVNLGTPLRSPHEDLAHRGHDANPSCVMFWKLELLPPGDAQVSPDFPPQDLDEPCKVDLRAAGGL